MSPHYLRGETVGGYDLRDSEKKFLIGVGFAELLELQDLQNNSFFSLRVTKEGGCWRCSNDLLHEGSSHSSSIL